MLRSGARYEDQDPPARRSPSADARAESRSNVFVIAALYSEAGSAPVRIRNMSRGGALVEGGVLPAEGGEVRLARGSLDVSGTIAWRNRDKAGLKFDFAVCVADWLPAGDRGSGQQRVDEIVYRSRYSGPASAGPPIACPAAAVTSSYGLAQELRLLSEGLRAAGEALASDPEVAMRYLAKLQVLDLATQRLDALATKMAADRG